MSSTVHHEDASAPVGVPPLGTLYFYLTEGCNLACRHCWLSPKFDSDGTRFPVLPVDTFEQIVREAEPLGLHTVKLTGGEPLLHPRFTDLVDVIRREKVRLQIETNGMLCTGEQAKHIASIPGAFVSLSIDGVDAETHEWLRGVKGAFDKACEAVRCLADAGIRPQIVMTLVERNVAQIEPMVRLAERLGAASVKFNIVQPTARSAQMHEDGSTLSVEALLRLGTWVDRELSRQTRLSLHYDYPAAFRPLGRISRADERCGILGILGVLSTGHYALCGIGMHIKKLVFGKAGEDNIRDIWETHPVLLEIRAGLPSRLEGVCGRCLLKRQCFGSCLAQNYYESGSLWAAHWFCEQAYALGVFPPSRLAELSDGERRQPVEQGGELP